MADGGRPSRSDDTLHRGGITAGARSGLRPTGRHFRDAPAVEGGESLRPPARYEAGEPFPLIGALLTPAGEAGSLQGGAAARWPDDAATVGGRVPAQRRIPDARWRQSKPRGCGSGRLPLGASFAAHIDTNRQQADRDPPLTRARGHSRGKGQWGWCVASRGGPVRNNGTESGAKADPVTQTASARVGCADSHRLGLRLRRPCCPL